METSRGRWSVPDGPTETLAKILAQHETGYYGGADLGVHRNDVVIDCGAHIGTYTRHALSRGAALVVAAEPAPAECLRRNLVAEQGIWAATGQLSFNVNFNAGAAGSFTVRQAGSSPVTVPVTTINALVRKPDLERVDFIKADIKGATMQLLAGAKETIRRFRPRMVLATEEPGEEPEAVIALGRREGYAASCGNCWIGDGQILLQTVFLQ